METIPNNDPEDQAARTACSAEKGNCGCSNGLCPGTILGGIVLAGWGLYAVGTWVWGLIAG